MQGARVQSLVRELDPECRILRILHAAAKRSNVLRLRPGAARKKEKEKKKKLLGNAKPVFMAVRTCYIQLCVPQELGLVPSGC